jgi:hypothetical protein
MSKEIKEAAERYVEQITTAEFGEAHNAPHRVKSFIAGANWQQERMYSEEELFQIIAAILHTPALRDGSWEDIGEWFEQFKKK